MEFTKLTLDCMQTIRPYFSENPNRICSCTTGGTFLWRDFHKTEYTIENSALYIKVSYPNIGTAFAPPRLIYAGVSTDKALYMPIFEYCQKKELQARICAVSEAMMNAVLEMYPRSHAHTDRAWSDYLYLSEDIINLPGRKYSGQRNHINRFKREHPNWKFETITPDNLAAVRAFFDVYAKNNVKDYPAYEEGNIKTLEILDNYELYGLCGGALFADDTVIGAAIGEILGDTLFVHTEKADTSFHGSYPMLVNTFAGAFSGGGVAYINREEDDGVEGLRTSKLSYHPISLLDKYVIDLVV